ncbi:hypothetical protein RCL1_000092 [Eukaryota sp. TZLM3-RCL]
MSTVIYNHSILDQLLKQIRNSCFTDFEIIFEDRTFRCHKAIAVLASKTIASSVALHENTLHIDEFVETTPEVIEAVIDSFYGVSLEVNNKNAMEVFECARFLGISTLHKLSKSVVKEFLPKIYTPSLLDILCKLRSDQYREFSLIYKSVSLRMHMFILGAVCPVFLSRFELQPGDNEWNFTDLLTVQESSLKNFSLLSIRIASPLPLKIYSISHIWLVTFKCHHSNHVVTH